MFCLPAKTLRAAAFSISALLATTAALPAHAQVSVSIGFDNFHNRLSPYGTWSNHPRWGEVWHPRSGRDFRPYYNGHWEDTQEYGWLWVSEDSWGDIPYHYGRWVSDPREGWLWVPGYVWGPSWVVWREGGGNIGWFPMPPGDDYYGDGAYRDNFENQYGYRDWYGSSFNNDQFLSLWIFVGADHFRDRNFRNYALPQRDYGRFFTQTRNTTNYVTVNNYVVNRSVDERRFQGTGGQRVLPVPARTVIGRDAPVTQASAGRQIEQRERQRHPIPVSIDQAERRGNQNSNAQLPNAVQGPQRRDDRGGNQGPNSKAPVQTNSQPGREPPAAPAAPVAEPSRQPPRGGQANINRAEQRGRGNDQGTNSNAESKKNPPRVLNVPQAKTAPANDGSDAPSLVERRNPKSEPQAQVREAPEPKEKVVVQIARRPARIQETVPAADAPRNKGYNGARGNRQGDANRAGDQKKEGDSKKAASPRGRN